MNALNKTTAATLALLLVAALTACTVTNEPVMGHKQLGLAGANEPFDIVGERSPRPVTLHSVARICLSQGRDPEAEVVLNRLVSEYADFMPAYNDLAALYLRNEMLDSAIGTLAAGLERDPADPVLLNNLGICHLLRNEREESLEQFTAAAAANPVDARNRANMAVGLAFLGRMDEAMALYLQILPPADAHWNMGVLCEANGDFEAAGDHFMQAEKLAAAR